jgi:hypothetical protein
MSDALVVMSTKQIEDAIMSNDPIVAKQLLEVIFDLENTESADRVAMTELACSAKYKHLMAPMFRRKTKVVVVVDLTGDD